MSNNRTVKKPAPPGSKPSTKPTHKGYVAPEAPKRAVSPMVLVIVGVIVVAVVAAIAVALSSGSGDQARTEPGVEQTQSVTTEGDALAPFDPSVTPDPAVGAQGPTLEGSTFSGGPITINPGGGEKYTMLVFAAHWCPHCQKEIPIIAKWMQDGKKPADLDVYAVSTGVRTEAQNAANNWPPSAWFEEVGWPMDTVLVDTGPEEAANGEEADAAAKAYGVTGFPMVIMLGPDGSVIERHSGEFATSGAPETFEAWVARTMQQG